MRSLRAESRFARARQRVRARKGTPTDAELDDAAGALADRLTRLLRSLPEDDPAHLGPTHGSYTLRTFDGLGQ